LTGKVPLQGRVAMRARQRWAADGCGPRQKRRGLLRICAACGSRIVRIARHYAEVCASHLALDVRLHKAVELCLRSEMKDQGYLKV